MGDVELEEDDIINRIDWESLLDFTSGDLDLFVDDRRPPTPTDSSEDNSSEDAPKCNSSPVPACSSIGEIEQLLMKDDVKEIEENHELYDDFFSDLFLDASPALCSEPRVSSDEISNPETNVLNDSQEKNKGDSSDEISNPEMNVSSDSQVKNKGDSSEEDNGEDGDDPISKKRKRQLRNRDAAVRSRERKKTYVRDLEMKSRYLEGECWRLERLLQCCFAENQALHLHLQKGRVIGAYMTKQESAVLFLESLLLGSLLWFLGIMCLFSLRGLPLLVLTAYPLKNVRNNGLEIVALRGARNKRQGLRLLQLFMSKGCKASRTKMKLNALLTLPVLA